MHLSTLIEYLESAGISIDLKGSADVEILQVSSLLKAKKGNISFLSDSKRIKELDACQASAVILKAQHAASCQQTCLIVENPYFVYAMVAQLLNPVPQYEPGAARSAMVSASAKIGQGVSIGEQVFIGDDVHIGDSTVIRPGCVIEAGVHIGEGCHIAPNVVIMHDCSIGNQTTIEAGTVIGGDGFGWANHQGKWIKIPQIGKVRIGSGVSIGNNCTIDRGAIEDTIIEDGCIIDNLVQIAHNVQLGEACAIAGQAGFAGSTQLGQHCTVAGQAGFAGHLKVADNSHVLAKAGVTHNLTQPGIYAGFPAIEVGEWQRNSVRSRQLDKMAKQIKALQKELNTLQEKQTD
ncbi:MAG: UDP-3-O-(3-hydroxymyristoyl)glucosamine N-acyltransferase [Thiomicrorhabdus chilensis]|uniref:UDP-3-O-(3-hydroxymyristoyl)glucosamine N-acyltransferase n=1 Tax=Thiomicrorhabdus chilensis TaxID=63656 RepID=UPI00299F45DF|nr:UDP-3-O-(3-hydroxymyristoyl)glucosamine N-acyltransferase [Thiomicrorhabdus chilensis]MDX1348248.1 UDP-3-O-(3-hydroxymyristoyl)glucosamine N-acyltransferase [Thiomicrorhabdus chilensis]